MRTNSRQYEVIVIGGGLAGLTAAYTLTKAGLGVGVLEKQVVIGGRIRSETVEGMTFDLGAGFIASFYTNTLRLISELGIGDRLQSIPGSGAVVRDELRFQLGPGLGRLSAKSRVCLAGTMCRMLTHWLELDAQRFDKASGLDSQSIEDYCRRYLTPEVLEFIIQPVMAGTFYWEPDQISQAMLFMLLKARLGMRQATFQRGMAELPTALATRLKIISNAEVMQVWRSKSGKYQILARVQGEDQHFESSSVICAVEGTQVSNIILDLTETQRSFFRQVHYSSTIVVAVKVDGRPLGPHSYVLFPREGKARYLASITSLGSKMRGTTEPADDVLKLYTRSSGASALMEKEDREVAELLLEDAVRANGLDNIPRIRNVMRVQRWPTALPIFGVGSFRNIAKFNRQESSSTHLAFAGDYLGGPWIEGAVSSGLAAAKRIAASMGT